MFGLPDETVCTSIDKGLVVNGSAYTGLGTLKALAEVDNFANLG